MSSRWDRPKPRVYEYNYKIQSDYYRPTLANLDTGKKDPQAKSFAERIKKYPLYGGEYPDRPEEEEYQGRQSRRRENQPVLEDGRPAMFYRPSSTRGLRSSSVPPGYERRTRDTSAALLEARAKLQELEERQFPQRQHLWQKHPYYVPEESIVVPPHESSIWPESRPHFHLVSSYDLMVGYLGIKGMGERHAEGLRRRGAQ